LSKKTTKPIVMVEKGPGGRVRKEEGMDVGRERDNRTEGDREQQKENCHTK
jgi:hypothetical protein